MAKKINYAQMFTLRADGRYQGYWRDLDENGEPKGKRHTICDRDPERLYNRIQEKEQPKALTVKSVSDKWWAERIEVLAWKSIEAYKPVLKRVLNRFGDRQLDDVETADVNAFLHWLAGQDYAKRTVQMHRDILSQIYNYAIAHELTRYNPCDHAVMPKGLSQDTRGIPSDKAIEAVQKNYEHQFALFAQLCLYAGLRRGEALGLRYEDIDRKAKLIHVRRSVYFVGNNPHTKAPKTENSKRDVLLLDALAARLPTGSGYIFVGECGEPISRDRYRDRWKSYCKYIGFPDLTAHQLRHGFATILYEAGVPDKDAQELLGHSDITLTRNIYTHIRSAQKAKTADLINSYLEPKQNSADCKADCKGEEHIEDTSK